MKQEELMAKRKQKPSKNNKRPQKPSPQNAMLGTALITNFVKNAKTKEEDRPILEAIKDSVWSSLNGKQANDQKLYWAAAAILAAYSLGREGLKLPVAQPDSQNLEDNVN